MDIHPLDTEYEHSMLLFKQHLPARYTTNVILPARYTTNVILQQIAQMHAVPFMNFSHFLRILKSTLRISACGSEST